jgi:hypothetical protein
MVKVANARVQLYIFLTHGVIIWYPCQRKRLFTSAFPKQAQ